MKQIDLKKYRLSGSKHCFVIFKGYLVEHLSSIYGRRIALKVFDDVSVESVDDIYKVKWGDDPKEGEPRINTTLWEATQIQNIAAWHGLAPRVYGIETVFLGGKYRPAQVIEPVEEGYHDLNEAFEVYKKIENLGRRYGFVLGKSDVSADDAMEGKLIDFQTFYFTRPYEDTVKEIYCEDGKYGKVYYQDVPEVGLKGGPRKSELRIKELGLDKIAFNGKSVWDVGCAGGFFTRYAIDRGAKRVTGIDMEGPVHACRNMANLLGYFNIDYQVEDLSKEKVFIDSPRPDIVLYLSLNYHVGYPEFLKYCPFVVLEDNGKTSRADDSPGNPIEGWFDKIDFIGRNTDHGEKPIYHLSHL